MKKMASFSATENMKNQSEDTVGVYRLTSWCASPLLRENIE